MKRFLTVLLMVLACATSSFAFTFTEFMGDKVAYLEPGECVKFNSYYVSNETEMQVMYPYERNYLSFFVVVPDTNEWVIYSNVKREGNKVSLGVNKSRYRGEMIYAGKLFEDAAARDIQAKLGRFDTTYINLGNCAEFENERYIMLWFNDGFYVQVFDKGVEK